MKKERLLARVRAFTIWQKNGFLPWSKPKDKTKNGSFYKGAFDSIPFLNDDAKRTFLHLLLRLRTSPLKRKRPDRPRLLSRRIPPAYPKSSTPCRWTWLWERMSISMETNSRRFPFF